LHFALEGLAGSDALELAAQILADNNIARPPREGLIDLMKFLGGHPLSLQLVLPRLGEVQSVEKLMMIVALLLHLVNSARWR